MGGPGHPRGLSHSALCPEQGHTHPEGHLCPRSVSRGGLSSHRSLNLNTGSPTCPFGEFLVVMPGAGGSREGGWVCVGGKGGLGDGKLAGDTLSPHPGFPRGIGQECAGRGAQAAGGILQPQGAASERPRCPRLRSQLGLCSLRTHGVARIVSTVCLQHPPPDSPGASHLAAQAHPQIL